MVDKVDMVVMMEMFDKVTMVDTVVFADIVNKVDVATLDLIWVRQDRIVDMKDKLVSRWTWWLSWTTPFYLAIKHLP